MHRPTIHAMQDQNRNACTFICQQQEQERGLFWREFCRQQFCFYCHLSGPFISKEGLCTIKMSEKMSNLARGDIKKSLLVHFFMCLICTHIPFFILEKHVCLACINSPHISTQNGFSFQLRYCLWNILSHVSWTNFYHEKSGLCDLRAFLK